MDLYIASGSKEKYEIKFLLDDIPEEFITGNELDFYWGNISDWAIAQIKEGTPFDEDGDFFLGDCGDIVFCCYKGTELE